MDGSAASASRSATKAASSFRNLAGAFTAMLVAQKAREGLTAVAGSAIDFEFSLKRLKVLTAGYNVDMGKMRQAAMSAAEKTTYGPQEAVEALIKLTQATGNADMAMAALDSTMGLAMASMGKLKPEQAARMAADVIKSFGAGGGTQEQVTERLKQRFDMLYNTTRSLGIEIETFSKIMGRAGQSALISGQTYEEVLLGMTLAARGAPSTLRASNQFMRSQAELVTKGTPIFRKLGIEVEAAGGKIRPYMDMMLDLAKKYEENPENVMLALTGGGLKGEKGMGMGAIQPMLTTLNALQKVGIRVGDSYLKGADALAHLRKEQYKFGTISAASADSMKSGKGAVDMASEAWTNLGIVVGETLLPAIRLFAGAMKTLLDYFRKFGETGIGKAIGSVVGPLTAGGTLLVTLLASLYGIKSILGVTGLNVFGGLIDSGKKIHEVFSKASQAVAATRAAELGAAGLDAFKVVGGANVAGSARVAGSAWQTFGKAMEGFKGHLIIGVIVLAVTALIMHTEKLIGYWRTFDNLLKQTLLRGGSALKGWTDVFRKYEILGGEKMAKGLEASSKFMQDAARAQAAAMAKSEESSKRLRDNFTIGAGALQKALDNLKDVTKAKTQVIDVRQMNSIMANLQKAKFATPGDEATRAGTMAMGKSITADLRKMTTTGLSPTEYKRMVEKISAFTIGAEDISTFHSGTISGTAMKNLYKQLVDPAIAGGSMLQARRTDTLRRLRGERSFLGGGAEMLPGQSKGTEMFNQEALGPTMKSLKEEQEWKRKEEEAKKGPVERVLEDMNKKAQAQLDKLDRVVSALESMSDPSGVGAFLGLRG
ncbi:MAG: phage tail tape measure protein [Bacteroidetes bacterium]|nr:phage tail tape measure protein [Bacteroidota bacterium]